MNIYNKYEDVRSLRGNVSNIKIRVQNKKIIIIIMKI